MLPTDRQAALDAVAAELGPMTGRPFGFDERGERIEHGTGRLVAGAIEWMDEYIERDVTRRATSLPVAERAARAGAAVAEAETALVDALNAAIRDRRYHVSAEYMRNEGHNYSYEFRLYVAEYCKAISGDPRFFFHQGPRMIPSALGLMSRPLGTRGTYAVLPRLVAKVIKTDLEVVSVADGSAAFRWYAASQLELVPPHLHERYTRYACEIYQGTFAEIPALAGNPAAEVVATECQADGAEYCEWLFTWDEVGSGAGQQWLVAGAAGSIGLVAAATRERSRLGLSAIGTLLPATAGYLLHALSRARARSADLSTRLEENRALAEEEYDANLLVNSELQSANVELQLKLSELSALYDLSVATQATLRLDEVIERSLATLVDNLSFERALVMLVDEDRDVLTDGHALGGTPEQDELIRTLDVHLDNPEALFGQLLRSDDAVLYERLDESEYPRTRELAGALGASSILGAPLITRGDRVGILAVDNGRSGRPLADSDRQLLFAAANLIAGAVGSARLYEAVARQNESLQREVRELQIEIDHGRKSEQVAEITGSDYFQDLRRQALELRETLGAGPTDR